MSFWILNLNEVWESLYVIYQLSCLQFTSSLEHLLKQSFYIIFKEIIIYSLTITYNCAILKAILFYKFKIRKCFTFICVGLVIYDGATIVFLIVWRNYSLWWYKTQNCLAKNVSRNISKLSFLCHSRNWFLLET